MSYYENGIPEGMFTDERLKIDRVILIPGINPNLTPRELDQTLNLFGEKDGYTLAHYHLEQEAIMEEMEQLKSDLLSEVENGPISAASLTAQTIHIHNFRPLHTAAGNLLLLPREEVNIKRFGTLMDYTRGMDFVLSNIISADEYLKLIRNGFEDDSLAPIQRKRADKLKAEPGFHFIVSESVAQIRNMDNSLIGDLNINPQLMLAGAEFTQRAYFALYPIAKKLCPEPVIPAPRGRWK